MDDLNKYIYILVNIKHNIMKVKAKVWKNKGNGQKLITIPKFCNIEDGDEVLIEKVEE